MSGKGTSPYIQTTADMQAYPQWWHLKPEWPVNYTFTTLNCAVRFGFKVMR